LKYLLLNQCFYPDVAATGQYLTDLALELTERGHQVTVLTSNRGYDDPTVRYARRENWRGIEIIRISSLSPGKETRWRRALNFGSFLINCAVRLLLLPKFAAVVALTSPPLISFLGSLFAQLKGGKLFFWVMDLNPDEAIAAGWLKQTSLSARILESLLRHSLRHAEKVIVLDRFMKARILRRGIDERKILVSPPWGLSDAVCYEPTGRAAFRKRHDLDEKFVVMYAGNHSPCHPLDTLLEAARRLSDQTEIAFCFVGGGSEQKKVKHFAARYDLQNILCLPYQPISELAGSLSAADLHVVVMGDKFVGIIHPCKIYNILAVGSPFLYIGPDESHIIDIAKESRQEEPIYIARHGDTESVVNQIRAAAGCYQPGACERTAALSTKFSRENLLPTLINALESVSVSTEMTATVVSETSV
jgi:colanic acid biosynthesis glycosyl transferase WcaI